MRNAAAGRVAINFGAGLGVGAGLTGVLVTGAFATTFAAVLRDFSARLAGAFLTTAFERVLETTLRVVFCLAALRATLFLIVILMPTFITKLLAEFPHRH